LAGQSAVSPPDSLLGFSGTIGNGGEYRDYFTSWGCLGDTTDTDSLRFSWCQQCRGVLGSTWNVDYESAWNTHEYRL